MTTLLLERVVTHEDVILNIENFALDIKGAIENTEPGIVNLVERTKQWVCHVTPAGAIFAPMSFVCSMDNAVERWNEIVDQTEFFEMASRHVKTLAIEQETTNDKMVLLVELNKFLRRIGTHVQLFVDIFVVHMPRGCK